MNKLFILFVLLFVAGCKDKYDIQLKDTDKSLLVVEGVLAAGQDSSFIMLSQTIKVNDKINFKPVLKANLIVEEKNGRTFSLKELGNGRYANSPLGLLIGSDYRLRIRTADNKEYLSDYVAAKQTPAIDSITWKKEIDGLVIYANTHDATNSTKYYKWDYDETWEIRSHYVADYEYTGGSTIIPSPSHNYRCWRYGVSNTINIGTSAQLASDIISESPIQSIPNGSEKLSVRYSILVRQQSLTKEAYEYLKLMKKNTESIGSIFDALPSELKGNIHCLSNPDEGVIGYLTASAFSQKRFFITALEANWRFTENCSEVQRVKNNSDSIRLWVPSFLPWGAEELLPGVVTYYYMSPAFCVDCTKRGGTLGMPAYW
jgi:hypothetical protein